MAGQLFVHPINQNERQKLHCYKRSVTTKVQYDKFILSSNNGSVDKQIYIVGIPTVISPVSDESSTFLDCQIRLYIYSDILLSEFELVSLDEKFKDSQCSQNISPFHGNLSHNFSKNSFVIPQTFMVTHDLHDGFLSNSNVLYSKCVTFASRFAYADIVHDGQGEFYGLCLDTGDNLDIEIRMPGDFHLVTPKRGFFVDQNTNLILSLFTRYRLSSEQLVSNAIENHHFAFSSIDTENSIVVNYLIEIITRLGFHEIAIHSKNQIVAFDPFFTLVVGPIHNIKL